MEEKDERKKLWTFILAILCIFLMPIKGMAVETTGTQDDAIDAYEQIEKVLEISWSESNDIRITEAECNL